MNLTKNGITIEVADAMVVEMLLQRLNGSPEPASYTPLPQIGEAWKGGIYAGLTLLDNLPVALVLLPQEEKLNWKDAIAWAEKQGGVLPSRIDQLVLFQNLKDQFKSEYYWSGEQVRADSDYAWVQNFGDGNQGDSHKDDEFPCRAVRRVPIR